ncbi:unnamed protein product [Aspergillus oryzae]|nr:unnamed protein product [Aspergillus oryzae]
MVTLERELQGKAKEPVTGPSIESEQDEDTMHQGDAFSFEVVHGRGYQVSRWKIEGSTTVTMDEIRFDLDMFPGRHYERDLVITKADLLKFARRF